jgi:hypothetical protein
MDVCFQVAHFQSRADLASFKWKMQFSVQDSSHALDAHFSIYI